MDAGGRVSRRGALAGLGAMGAAALAGCAAERERGDEASLSSTPVATEGRGAASPSAGSGGSDGRGSSPAVDPSAVAARYAASAPTTWGLDLPGIRRSLSSGAGPRVALTFDACGGSGGSRIDDALISVLRAQAVPATLFLNGRWVGANPSMAAELAADPLFLIGNHGTRHVPLSVTGHAAYGIPGTRSAAEAVDEVWQNQLALTSLLGHPPRFFRPGTAFYDDVGVRIARDLGVEPVGFAVNGDAGATFPAATVRAQVRAAADGSIVIAHMNQPGHGTSEGIAAAIADLRGRGFAFVHVDA